MTQDGVVCQPGPALLFYIFWFEYLVSGPKSYRDFRETGPRPVSLCYMVFPIEVSRESWSEQTEKMDEEGGGGGKEETFPPPPRQIFYFFLSTEKCHVG